MANKSYKKKLFKEPIRFKRQVQNSTPYKQQRDFAMMRAGYRCELCGKTIGNIGEDGKEIKSLDMHHLNEMIDILTKNNIETLDQALCCMELFDMNNVQILCKPCHRKTDSYSKHRK